MYEIICAGFGPGIRSKISIGYVFFKNMFFKNTSHSILKLKKFLASPRTDNAGLECEEHGYAVRLVRGLDGGEEDLTETAGNHTIIVFPFTFS